MKFRDGRYGSPSARLRVRSAPVEQEVSKNEQYPAPFSGVLAGIMRLAATLANRGTLTWKVAGDVGRGGHL
jgi:hypothetical protein